MFLLLLQMSQPGQQVTNGQLITFIIAIVLYFAGLIGIHVPR